MSSNGRFQLSSTYVDGEALRNSNYYSSNDYGVTWTTHEADGSMSAVGSAMSSGGKRQIVARSTESSPLSTDYGQTFQQYVFNGLMPSDITTIAYSDTARYQIVGSYLELAVSNDHGNSWRVLANGDGEFSSGFFGATLSFNGEYQLATNATHYFVSSNYGQDWAVHSGPPDTQFLVWINMNEDAHIAMLTDIDKDTIYSGECGWTATFYVNHIIAVTADVYVPALF